jgi:hypothetical protein
VDITVDTDGDAGDATDTITATTGHPMWVDSQATWRDAGTLSPGDTLLAPDGSRVRVIAIAAYGAPATVHNLTVDTIHTYYVVAAGTPVLVHNCGDDFIGPKDHVALGRDDYGLEDFADQVGGRRISANDWRGQVRAAVARVGRGEGNISFMVDGLPGHNRGVAGAVKDARAAAARGEHYLMHTQWELLQIADAGLLDKVSFFRFNRKLGAWAKL